MRAATSAVAARDRGVPGRRGRPRAGATVTSPPSTPAAQSSDCSRKSAGSRRASAMPSFARLRRRRHLVLLQRVLDDDGDRAGRCRSGSAAAGCRPSRGPGRGRPRGSATIGRRRRSSGSGSAAPAPGRRRAPTPLTKANVGTGESLQPAEHPVPGLGDLQRLRRASVTDGTPVRSAPTAKMNGLPVTAIADGRGGVRRDLVERRVERRPARPGRTWSAWCGRGRCRG